MTRRYSDWRNDALNAQTPLSPLPRAALLVAQLRGALRADESEHARAIIARAEALGFVREPSMPEAYEEYLMADAKDAALYLATAPAERDVEGFIADPDELKRYEARQLIAGATARGWTQPAPLSLDHAANPCDDCLFADADEARGFLRALDEPDRCTECGAVQLCDCRVYLVPRP